MNISLVIKHVSILVFVIGVLGCSSRYSSVEAVLDEKELKLIDGGGLNFSVIVSSESPVTISFHEDISEVMYLSVLNDLCKTREFYSSKRVSRVHDEIVSKNKRKKFTLTGTVKKSAVDNHKIYELDFGRLGKVCVPGEGKSELYVTLVPSEFDSIYRDDKVINAEPLILDPTPLINKTSSAPGQSR